MSYAETVKAVIANVKKCDHIEVALDAKRMSL